MSPNPAVFVTLLGLAVAAASAEAGAAVGATVEIVEYGEYAPYSETGKERAPGTSLGYVGVVEATRDPVLLTWTDVVVAEVGGWFGIKVLVHGPPSFDTVPLRIRVLHPPFRNPASGELSEREEWDAEMNIGIPRFAGWSFGEPWELVPGRWTMQVLDGDEVVAELGFEVVLSPSEVEDALAGGRPADPLGRIPEELWERATLIVSGRYEEGRSPCIWVGEDRRVWLLTQGFSITDRFRGEIRGDYVGIELPEPSQTPYLCADCLVPGREYLLLLRPSPASMRFLDTEYEAYHYYNTLGAEELLAIVEVPAGPSPRITVPAPEAAAPTGPPDPASSSRLRLVSPWPAGQRSGPPAPREPRR